MYGAKLVLSTSNQFGLPVEQQIELFKKCGFDGFFTGWDEHLKAYRKKADALDMLYQSVHAPFANAAYMWEKSDKATQAVEELVSCVRDSGEIRVPLVIVHPYIGFKSPYIPTSEGIENFRIVVEEAKKQNIKIAFENVEGEEYLEALMQAFKEDDAVGFCWDSGHELCYNKGKDMLKLYGSRLLATHLNDSLGVSDKNGKIIWTDDLHLLPFDGIHNWEKVANRLNQCNYNGVLTFELNKCSKPNRHDNDKYQNMDIETYIAECYARACRFAYIKQN